MVSVDVKHHVCLLTYNRQVNIQGSSSLSQSKRYLTNNYTKVPSYYYFGKRDRANNSVQTTPPLPHAVETIKKGKKKGQVNLSLP